MSDFYVVKFIYENGVDEVFLTDYDSALILFRSISLSDHGIEFKLLKSFEVMPKLFSDHPSDNHPEYKNSKVLLWEAIDSFIIKL